MKTFKSFYLIEKTEELKHSVALVPGSYKPPHAGHLDMVKKYSDIANKVIVIISDPKSKIRKTSTGKVITPEIAKEIWELYIDSTGLTNVEVIISSLPSPVAAAYDYVMNNDDVDSVIFGASKKDNDWKRWATTKTYFAKHKPSVKILDPETYAVEPYENISATDIRNNIDRPEEIRKYLPKELSDEDFQKIVDLLN